MPNVSDTDLMLLADGELDPTEAAAIERRAGLVGAHKVAGIQEVGELVRGHLELSADEAEHRLSGLWDQLERRLGPAEAARVPDGTDEVKSPARPGLWSRLPRWIDGHRGHFLTGALSAGAVAAVALMLRAPEPRVVIQTVEVPGAPGPIAMPVLQATAPEIESLEVSGGSGTVFTIEDEDGGETAVIWVTPDDVVEGI